MHGGGWFSYISAEEKKPQVTTALLKRVLKYASGYRFRIITMLALILINTGLTLLTPLIVRDLIDRTIPAGNLPRLALLALALLLIPGFGGLINVIQRRLNAQVGEGVIYDLRVALYARLQRMSLRFFTNTRVGELMSRLNNDVVGAQNAISNTIVGIITNIIQAAAVAGGHADAGMAPDADQRGGIAAVYPGSAKNGETAARDRARTLEANAQMNAMMNETLNIGGALLVKLFGRTRLEVTVSQIAQRQCARYRHPAGSAGTPFLSSSGCSARWVRR